MRFSCLIATLCLAPATAQAQDSGNHTDWPRWCGKVYKPGYLSFEPGGEVTEPINQNSWNIYVQFKPRYNFYLENDTKASFVLNAEFSRWVRYALDSLWQLQ